MMFSGSKICPPSLFSLKSYTYQVLDLSLIEFKEGNTKRSIFLGVSDIRDE